MVSGSAADAHRAGTMTYDGPLWRLFRTRGRHRVAWNEFRRYGTDFTAIYAGPDAFTPFAGVFGRSKMIDPSTRTGWALAGWQPTRELTLLDLADSDALLPTADIKRTEPWPRFLGDDSGDRLDGVRGRSALGGGPVIILFEGSAGALPQTAAYNHPLAATRSVVAEAASRLGFGIRNY